MDERVHKYEQMAQAMAAVIAARKPIVIFGPPGSGKSTLCEYARGLPGWTSLDAEKVHPKYEVVHAALMSWQAEQAKPHIVLVGGAGMKPSSLPIPTWNVLLLPPRAIYMAHREYRDSLRPTKRDQPAGHSWADKLYAVPTAQAAQTAGTQLSITAEEAWTLGPFHTLLRIAQAVAAEAAKTMVL